MPRKPRALRELQGTLKDHPGRQNHNEPIPTRGAGEPPLSLNEFEREIWAEIIGISYHGVIGEADRMALEMMCRLVAEMRLDFSEMTAAKITQLSNLLARFGMTPSDRTKIVVPKKEKSNTFADLETKH